MTCYHTEVPATIVANLLRFLGENATISLPRKDSLWENRGSPAWDFL